MPAPRKLNDIVLKEKPEKLVTTDKRAKKGRTDIAAMIAMGYTQKQIIRHYTTGENPMKRSQVEAAIARAAKDIDAKYELYISRAAKYNINRLVQIIEDNYLSGNYKIVLDAIDMLNKMGGLYTNTINVDTNAPVVQLSFGNAPVIKKTVDIEDVDTTTNNEIEEMTTEDDKPSTTDA